MTFIIFGIFNLAVAHNHGESNEASEQVIYVKGMVCAFCAQGIERRFKGEPEISNINVELSDHKVTLSFNPGMSMDEKRIEKLLKAAGYSVDRERMSQKSL